MKLLLSFLNYKGSGSDLFQLKIQRNHLIFITTEHDDADVNDEDGSHEDK